MIIEKFLIEYGSVDTLTSGSPAHRCSSVNKLLPTVQRVHIICMESSNLLAVGTWWYMQEFLTTKGCKVQW